MNSSNRSAARPYSLRRLIVTGAILPVSLVTSARAADVLLPPNLNINSDAGAAIFVDGLREGFINQNDNENTPNPFNGPDNGQGAGISLGLRMGQSTAVGPTAWQDNRTWVYTGEIFTGPNGILSFAANNDDSDWISVNGVVQLNDNTWNVANATTYFGLTPNTWVPFEYRVANGGGGAGPSAQGANWNNATGVVFSYNDEGNSVDPSVYDQGKPTEVAGGGQSVFRFQNGFGLSDDLVVQDSATITIEGSNTTISELSLRFTNPNPATLTVNDAAATPHKVLSIAGLTQWATAASGGANVSLAGTSDLRPLGAQTDNGNIVTVTNNGPGKLILDTFNSGSNLISTTFAAGTGVVEVTSSSGTTPVPGAILAVNNPAGILRIGSSSTNPATFSNNIQALASGTLQHSSAAIDTLSGPITVSSGQNLNFDITGGRLIITAGVSANQSGAGITKSGPNLLRTTAAVNARNLIMNEGRFEALGNVNFFTNSPVLNGGVLVLGNTSGTNTLPNPFVISGAGAVEGRAGSFGPTTNVIQLTGGGTLRLSGNTGLQGSFYGGDSAGARGSFGGPTNPANTYLTFTTYFGARGGLEASALTSAGGVEVLSFDPAGGNTAMFGAYGQTRTDEIVARMMGKIFIPQAGTYTFSTTSDDGSMLFIDGVAVASNNADQGMTRRGGTVALSAGFHDIDMGYFEGGGGNGFVVDWAGPGITGTQVLPNSVLFPNLSPELFANPINVTGNSTLNTIAAAGRVTANVTVQSGSTLTTIGNNLAIDNLILPVSGGTYGFAPSNETTISQINDSGNPVTINMSGTGVLTIDNVGAAQLQNPGSTVSVNSGSLGILLGGATNPTGNAALAFNGGGVVLSSKNGNQNFTIPAFTGTSVNLQARKLASGLAGTQETPIVITLQGNLSVPAGATINLGTADNYVEQISGTASGSGTVGVTGGTVTSNSNTAMSGLRVNFSGVGSSATLNLATNGPKVGALNSLPGATADVRLGDGIGGTAILEVEGTANGSYRGTLNPAGISTFSVVKNGPGLQQLIGQSLATAYTINAGTLELSQQSFADAGVPINIAGGTLQFGTAGLLLRIYDTDPGATVGGAPGAYTGILNTLGGVFQRYNALGAPSITTNTAANGNSQISYNPGAGAEAPFAIHGQTDADTIEALFTGTIRIPTAGNWTFDPRSDDGTMVYVDGVLVSNNNVPQGIGHVPRPGTINLTEGLHSIVMTYNEGGGGAGMYVNVTDPNGTTSLLSNSLLFNPSITAGNPVNISGNSAINPNTGTVALGNATHASGAVLSANGGGTVSFLQSSPSAGTTLSYTINTDTVVRPGQIVGADTMNVSGAGSLLLDFNGAQLATGNINVSNGSVIAATTAGGANPLGGAAVNLSNGGSLNLTGTDPTADTTYSNALNIGTGGGFLRAGRFGVGTAGGFTMTYAAPINVTNGASFGLGAVDGYNLVLTNPVVSNGPISSVSGNVQTNAALTGTTLAVTGGRLDTIGALNFSGGATINTGSTLRLNGNTYTGGTVNVNGTLEFNGSTASALPTNIDGGLLRVVSGTVNFGSTAIAGSTPVISPAAGVLAGKAYNSVNPVGGFGTDQGIANTLAATPARTANLAGQDLNFGPAAQGDAPFNTFFGGALNDAFTATYSGTFTASGTGVNPFTFGVGIQDDNASVWVDLNQNGILEQNGSAGAERIINLGCCAGDPADNTTNAVVNLVGGQKYGVVFVVEDTGGGSGFAVKWAEGNLAGPGGLANFVNPAAQPAFWSADTKTGGAKLEVGAGSELRAGGFTNVGDAFLSGDGAKLALNGVSGTSATVDIIRNSINATSSTVEVGAGNTLTANHITVAPGTSLVKVGSGTLMAPALSIGGGGALNVTDGTVIYTATAQASAAGGNSGSVNISDTGTFNLQGTLSGAINVNPGGTLTGSGTLGALTAATNSIVSPGGTGIGTLNTGDALLLDDAILRVDLLSPASSDKLNVAGIVLLTETPGPVLNLTLAPGFTAQINDVFPLILNDLDDAVVGHFSGLLEGANVNVGNNVFQVTYVANLDAGVVGNDVALIYTVPEPGALVMLLGGFGMLVGAQRIRRKGQS